MENKNRKKKGRGVAGARLRPGRGKAGLTRTLGGCVAALLLLGCAAEEKPQKPAEQPPIELECEDAVWTVPAEGGSQRLGLVSKVTRLDIRTPRDTAYTWCRLTSGQTGGQAYLSVLVTANPADKVREAVYLLSAADFKETRLTVRQPGGGSSSPEPDPGPDLPPQEDEQVRLTAARLVEGYGGIYTYGSSHGPELMIDGDLSTVCWLENQTDPDKPGVFILDVAPGTEKIDYLRLYQGSGNKKPNMTDGKVEFRNKDAGEEEWIECGAFQGQKDADVIRVPLKGCLAPVQLRLTLERDVYLRETPDNPKNVTGLRIAEVQAFIDHTSGLLEEDASYFADPLLSALKPGFSRDDLAKIRNKSLREMAKQMSEGRYTHEFRLRTYRSQADPVQFAVRYTVGWRSICDIPMGLLFEKGKKYMVAVQGLPEGKSVTILLMDFQRDGQRYELKVHNGLNEVGIDKDAAYDSGTAYLQYWTDLGAAPLPELRIHVCNAPEIGFWDRRAGHTDVDWQRILALAEQCVRDRHLDRSKAVLGVGGRLMQIVCPIVSFRKHCSGGIEKTIDRLDRILEIEYRLMGFYKHDAVPSNRMLGVKSWGGSPNWNGRRANFPSEGWLLNENGFDVNIWGIAHEFGHGNQPRQMRGASWTEVTNNIYSGYCQYLLGGKRCRLEESDVKRQRDETQPGFKDMVYGERFNIYLNEGSVQGRPYLTHGSKDHSQDEGGDFESASEFVSLVPLWQLSLFFQLIGEESPWYRPDFWADVIWDAMDDGNRIRETQGEAGNDDWGRHLTKFMKRTIRASGYNLCPFLKAMGILQPYDHLRVSDYGSKKIIDITQAEIDEIIALGEKYPPQPTPVLHYISANSLEAFAKRLPVEGRYGEGVTDGPVDQSNPAKWPEKIQHVKLIDHKVWKHTVGFRTYKGKELLDVCITGTHSLDNSRTMVRFPEGADRIEAVQWDGREILVYGKRP